jgi:hypothetical protein
LHKPSEKNIAQAGENVSPALFFQKNAVGAESDSFNIREMLY